MPRPTYRAMLRELQKIKTHQYRSDNEANEEILDGVVETVELILKKLAEQEDGI